MTLGAIALNIAGVLAYRSKNITEIEVILPFLVQANIDDHTLAVTCESAKEAFAKAVEWQVVRFTDVSISDGTKSVAFGRRTMSSATV